MKTITATELDYHELDTIVRRVFDAPKYQFLADIEARNDTCYSFTFEQQPLDEFEMEDIAELREKQGFVSFKYTSILQALVNLGELPPGHILIQVSW